MAVRRIVKVVDEVLTKVSRPVKEIDKRILTLLDDMRTTMYAADGVGLAAPQVGILRRVVVVDVGDGIIELINPEIIASSGSCIDIEGCLSAPGRNGKVERPEKVTVRALNRKGEMMQYEAEGLLARCFCHEIDHLEGILFTSKCERMLTEEEKKEMLEKNEEEEK